MMNTDKSLIEAHCKGDKRHSVKLSADTGIVCWDI